MKFLVVEDRKNKYTDICFDSLKSSKLDYEIIKTTDAGDLFDEFKKNYTHFSTNSPEFELICFRRYFLLAIHLKKCREIKEFVLSDSDIIFFPGADLHIKTIANDLEVLASTVHVQSEKFKMASPHLSYWKRESLFEFLSFLIDFYKNPTNRQTLESCLNEFLHKGLRGGVTDMTLIYLFLKSKNLEKETITKIANAATLDHNISVGDNSFINEYKTFFGIKKIIFSNGEVFVKKKIDNLTIKFYALHFQGKSKILMTSCYRQQATIFMTLATCIGTGKWLKNLTFKYIRRVT